jgi:cell fate (sporulation/competence/biofilm development) regulator YmcA (YheA/YmcA/DUF963 family)
MTEKNKLISMLLENEEIKRYKRIEKHINENKKLKAKMNELKSIQKQLVNAKEVNKKNAIEEFQNRYDLLLNEIEEYPLMSDYLALQSEINEMMKEIVAIIEDGIESDFS